MLNKQLTSTKVGTSLLNKGGNAVQSKFDSMAVNRTLGPGDVLQVDGPPSLGCSKIFFIECLPWDGVRGNSVQVRMKTVGEMVMTAVMATQVSPLTTN